eukprot:7839232-Alexandrium_andersonii.AAC.1
MCIRDRNQGVQNPSCNPVELVDNGRRAEWQDQLLEELASALQRVPNADHCKGCVDLRAGQLAIRLVEVEDTATKS